MKPRYIILMLCIAAMIGITLKMQALESQAAALNEGISSSMWNILFGGGAVIGSSIEGSIPGVIAGSLETLQGITQAYGSNRELNEILSQYEAWSNARTFILWICVYTIYYILTSKEGPSQATPLRIAK